MAKLGALLTEKGVKSLEKARKNNSKSDWKIAKTLFDNLLAKAKHGGLLMETSRKDKVLTDRFGIPYKTITKVKIKKLRLPSVSLLERGVLFDCKALWVKPIIRNNRIVFFWKGQYIDGATIFGESINRYQ